MGSLGSTLLGSGLELWDSGGRNGLTGVTVVVSGCATGICELEGGNGSNDGLNKRD